MAAWMEPHGLAWLQMAPLPAVVTYSETGVTAEAGSDPAIIETRETPPNSSDPASALRRARLIPLVVIPVSIVDEPLSRAETTDRRMRPIVIVGVHPRAEGSQTFGIAREELSIGELLK